MLCQCLSHSCAQLDPQAAEQDRRRNLALNSRPLAYLVGWLADNGISTASSADGNGGAVASPACDYSFETGIRELHSCTAVVDVADESPRAKRARAVVYTASISDQSEGEMRRQQHVTWTQVPPCCLDPSANVTMIPALLHHCCSPGLKQWISC